METLIFKGKGKLWPTVTWKGSNLVVYYLGPEEDDVTIKETNNIDFEEFFLYLDRGGSIYVTVKPGLTPCEVGKRKEGDSIPAYSKTDYAGDLGIARLMGNTTRFGHEDANTSLRSYEQPRGGHGLLRCR
ncbi:MAG: hypothetical protein PVH79_02485 [Candidatus Bathyarchaeota archaeon]|jgi:hypothetical protein